MNSYLEVLAEELRKSEAENEVPIAAIIVKSGKIIAKSHNTRAESGNVLGHAEINCIIEASKYLGDWRLNGCDLYVTLEPCEMCKSVIRESRIDNVYFLIERLSYKHQFYKTNFSSISNEIDDMYLSDYKKKMSDFFKLNGKR